MASTPRSARSNCRCVGIRPVLLSIPRRLPELEGGRPAGRGRTLPFEGSRRSTGSSPPSSCTWAAAASRPSTWKYGVKPTGRPPWIPPGARRRRCAALLKVALLGRSSRTATRKKSAVASGSGNVDGEVAQVARAVRRPRLLVGRRPPRSTTGSSPGSSSIGATGNSSRPAARSVGLERLLDRPLAAERVAEPRRPGARTRRPVRCRTEAPAATAWWKVAFASRPPGEPQLHRRTAPRQRREDVELGVLVGERDERHRCAARRDRPDQAVLDDRVADQLGAQHVPIPVDAPRPGRSGRG